MFIEFISDYRVKASGGTSYAKGQRVEVSRASAEHFIERGAAIEFVGVAAKAASVVAQLETSDSSNNSEWPESDKTTGGEGTSVQDETSTSRRTRRAKSNSRK